MANDANHPDMIKLGQNLYDFFVKGIPLPDPEGEGGSPNMKLRVALCKFIKDDPDPLESILRYNNEKYMFCVGPKQNEQFVGPPHGSMWIGDITLAFLHAINTHHDEIVYLAYRFINKWINVASSMRTKGGIVCIAGTRQSKIGPLSVIYNVYYNIATNDKYTFKRDINNLGAAWLGPWAMDKIIKSGLMSTSLPIRRPSDRLMNSQYLRFVNLLNTMSVSYYENGFLSTIDGLIGMGNVGSGGLGSKEVGILDSGQCYWVDINGTVYKDKDYVLTNLGKLIATAHTD